MKIQGLKIINVVFHRNGVGGAGFHVVAFRRGSEHFIATVFDAPTHVAVISLDSEGRPEPDQCWRGDHFEPELRRLLSLFTRLPVIA